MEDCLESYEDNGGEIRDFRQHNVNKIHSGQPMSLPAVDRVLVRKMSPDHIQSSEGMSKIYRRSFDYNMFFSDHEPFQPVNLSHSDSELDRSHNLSTTSRDLTTEYLGFPRRLSARGPTSFLHKLDLTPKGVTLSCSAPNDRSVDTNAAQSLDNKRMSHSCNTFPLPKIEFSTVDTHKDDDCDSGGLNEQGSPQILMEHVNYEEDLLRGPAPWIQLEPSGHMLLSPRSSNGSISSFRSSNADSAIEILTPDEEVSDLHEGTEASLSVEWESNKHRKYSEDTAWNSDSYGAIKKSTSSSHPHDKATRHSSWQCSIHPSSDTSHSHTDTAQKLSFMSPVHSAINLSQSQRSSVGDMSVFQTPEVIISDFSCNAGVENKTARTENKCFQTTEPDIQSGLRPRYLGDYPYNIERSLSSSSISSNESSTYSIFSDSSQEVDESHEPQINMTKKQSSWKKIRNIVHWSPFIQQFKRRKYPWIQLAGHQGNFQAGDPGAILKKYDKREHRAFNKLMKDKLRPYVPEYLGEAAKDGECYLQLQDLLCEFEAPCVMDMKMGCRTYLEEELVKAREKPTLRKDMYQKMVEVDPNAPTEEEHAQKAITKPRYMQWRDDISSSANLGFRIEGIRKSDGAQVKNFKTTKDKQSVKECLSQYVEGNLAIVTKYLRRLKSVRATQEDSPFFKSHEIIGSSLLFVHDKMEQASIWMIDFGKTVPLPETVSVTHKDKWDEGNHEDGYLHGIDCLIDIFTQLQSELSQSQNVSVPCVNPERLVPDSREMSEQSDIKGPVNRQPDSVTGTVQNNLALDSDVSSKTGISSSQGETSIKDMQDTKDTSTSDS